MAPLTRGLELLGWAVSYALASAGLATSRRLSSPTPCAGWDLEWLLRHVGDSVSVLHEAITAGCIGIGATGTGAHGHGPGPGPGPGPEPGGGRPRPDPVADLYRRAGQLLAACAPALPAGRLVTIGDRGLAPRMVVATGAIELTVHGWDIAVTCGSRQPVPPGLAAVLLPIAPLFIPPGARAGLFADPVAVPGRACAGDQLVAFLGRQPHRPAGSGLS